MCSGGWSCSTVCCIGSELGYGPKRTGSRGSYGLARNQIFRRMTNVEAVFVDIGILSILSILTVSVVFLLVFS